MFIKLKAKAAIRNYGVAEALDNAAANGKLKMVQYLLKTYGQDAKARAVLGIARALANAVYCDKLEVVGIFLRLMVKLPRQERH